MKALLFLISAIILSGSVHANEPASTIPFELQLKMFNKAKDAVLKVCGTEADTHMPQNAQVLDSYEVVSGYGFAGRGGYDEISVYRPFVVGAAVCKSKNLLIQWTVSTGANRKGDTVPASVNLTVSLIK
jgi:hypothetical protein